MKQPWEKLLDKHAEFSRPEAAIASLTNHQVQCDEDGVMVQVSRQALNEVLAYLLILGVVGNAKDPQ